MSKLAPRNATVRILKADDGNLYVEKHYHFVYTVTQEQNAYQQIKALCENIQGIRLANILKIDEKQNSLFLEHIPGKNLYEILDAGDTGTLINLGERLMALFTRAMMQNIRFDSDPSNFILHAETGELVIVDPICTDLQLENFSMVIFLWGLIKVILRSLRFWRYPSIIKVWRTYYRNYLQRTGVDARLFNQEMVRYIDVVIKWNKEVSPVDSRVMTLKRRVVAVPMYTVAKWIFHLNSVHD